MKFTKAGAFYFSPDVYEWNLPAGHSCPAAKECRINVDRDTGKQIKGKGMIFPCYAASCERYPAVRKSRWENFDAVIGKTTAEIVTSIQGVLPPQAELVRVHASGDFFSQPYFDAWLEIARANPLVLFWAFTKSIPFWINRRDSIPKNLPLTASMGGKYDTLVTQEGLRYCKVFNTTIAAENSGLPIDTDDLLASQDNGSFALILRSEVAKQKRAKKTLTRCCNGVDVKGQKELFQ
jgi:Gene product 88